MKGNKHTYHTVEEMADNVCLDLGEGMHRKEQYLHWILKAMKRWKMDGAKEIKTVKLTMTAWKSVQFPPDCIDWIACGIQDGNVIKTFVNKNDIATYFEKDENDINIANAEPVSIPDFSIDTTQVPIPFYNYCDSWGNPGKVFGQQVKDNGFGYFTVNKNDDVSEIQFRTKVDSSSGIIFMYLADDWNPNSQSVIHPYVSELIELETHYRRLKFDKANGKRSISSDDVAIARKDRDDEYNRVVDRMWDFSTEDIIEVMSNGYILVPNQMN